MSKITLNNVASLIDATTAANTINANSGIVQTAFDNTLSRDGTAPNQMSSDLDMNSNQILNLPAPSSTNSPLRLQDLSSFIGGGTISTIPAGGTTAQALTKTSNADFVTQWSNTTSSVGLALPADFTVTNSPVTTTGTLTGAWVNAPTGTGGVVRATTPTITTPVISGHPTVEGITSTGATGTGNFVFSSSPAISSPTLTTPALGNATGTSLALTAGDISFATSGRGIAGTVTNDNANAGNVGEFISSTVLTGSALALTTAVPLNLTSISLGAGDWDVSCQMYFSPAASTNITFLINSISTTSATLDTAPGNYNEHMYATAGAVTGVGTIGINTGPRRLSLSGTTTVFAVADAGFTVSTMAVFGIIRARRIR